MFEWFKDCLSFFDSQSSSRQQPSRPKPVDRNSPLLLDEDSSYSGETKKGGGSTATERLIGDGAFTAVPWRSPTGSNGAKQGSSNRKRSPVPISRDIYIAALNELICAQKAICADLAKQVRQSEERLNVYGSWINHLLKIQDYFSIRTFSLMSQKRSTQATLLNKQQVKSIRDELVESKNKIHVLLVDYLVIFAQKFIEKSSDDCITKWDKSDWEEKIAGVFLKMDCDVITAKVVVDESFVFKPGTGNYSKVMLDLIELIVRLESYHQAVADSLSNFDGVSGSDACVKPVWGAQTSTTSTETFYKTAKNLTETIIGQIKASGFRLNYFEQRHQECCQKKAIQQEIKVMLVACSFDSSLFNDDVDLRTLKKEVAVKADLCDGLFHSINQYSDGLVRVEHYGLNLRMKSQLSFIETIVKKAAIKNQRKKTVFTVLAQQLWKQLKPKCEQQILQMIREMSQTNRASPSILIPPQGRAVSPFITESRRGSDSSLNFSPQDDLSERGDENKISIKGKLAVDSELSLCFPYDPDEMFIDDNTFRIQWYRNTSPIDGQTVKLYQLHEDDEGCEIKAVITDLLTDKIYEVKKSGRVQSSDTTAFRALK